MLFACDNCNCIDDTDLAASDGGHSGVVKSSKLLCCCCRGGTWHDQFPKRQYLQGTDIVSNRPSGIGLC